MSPSFRLASKALLASSLLAAVAAPSAHAITLNYQCKFPKVGVQPVQLAVGAALPTTQVPTGLPVGPTRVTGTFTFGGAFPSGLSTTEGLSVLWGVAEADQPGSGSVMRVRYARPDGTAIDQRVPLHVNPVEYASSVRSPYLSQTFGDAPAVTFSAPGQVGVGITALELNFRPVKADGSPVAGLSTPTTDVDGQPYDDVDGNAATFNAPCKLSPAGQGLQLGVINVIQAGPATIPPPGLPAPGAYQPFDIQERLVQLHWTPSAGGSRVKEYVVRYTPGGPEGGIRVPRNYSWWAILNLTPETAYRFAVSAVEVNGGETAPVIQEITTLSVPNSAPTTPGAPRILDSSPTRLELDWARATDADDGWVTSYDVYRDDVKVGSTESSPQYVFTNPAPGEAHTYHVVAVDSGGKRGEASERVTLRSFPEVPTGGRRLNYQCTFPTISNRGVTLDVKVGGPTSVGVGVSTGPLPVTAQLRFGPSGVADLLGIPRLHTLAGVSEASQPGKGTALLTQVTPPAGAPSAERAPLTLEPWKIAADPATGLGTLEATGYVPAQSFRGPGSARVALQQVMLNLRGLDADGGPVVDKLATPSQNLTGEPNVDVDGDPSTFNAPCILLPSGQNLQLADIGVVGSTLPTTPTPVGTYAFSASGSTALRSLAKSALPLGGAVNLTVDRATSAVSGALALDQVSGRLVAEGVLPVVAKIGFVPSGSATGTLQGGVLKIRQLMRIKVHEAKLFGAIPIAAGNNCQSKRLSDITLQSTEAGFDPATGGALAGTFAISDLNGCAGLNGLVSPLTAADGNPINLTITPKPASS